MLSLPVDESLASFHIDFPKAIIELGEACITYLSFSDFETQVTRRRPPLPVDKMLFLNSAVNQVPFGKRFVKNILTAWNYVRGDGLDSVNPTIDLTDHLGVVDTAPPSERMRKKYCFLNYATENWIWLTKNLTKENQRLWRSFAKLALEKQTMFEFRPWNNLQIPSDFPYLPLFYWAIEAGHGAVLQLLPDSGLELRDYFISQPHSTVLKAAERGSMKVLETLCAVSGLSLRDLPTKGVVYDAAATGNDKMLEVLLRLEAHPDGQNPEGSSALLHAFEGGHDSIVESLLRYGADPNLGSSEDIPILYQAAQNGHIALVETLLAAGANLEAKAPSSVSAWPGTPLQAAAQGGHTEVLKVLLAAKANVNTSSRAGYTALLMAANGGHFGVVKMLADAGADVNTVDKYNQTALMLTVNCCASADTVKVLLNAGADVNAVDVHHQTALMLAVLYHSADTVKMLLDAGADINAVDNHSDTALLIASRKAYFCVDGAKKVQILLDAGADINFRDGNGRSALELAEDRGREVVGSVVDILKKAKEAKPRRRKK